jgi:hypothetical protein
LRIGGSRLESKCGKEIGESLTLLSFLSLGFFGNNGNARVFGNTGDFCNVTQLVSRIKDEFRVWKQAFFGGRNTGERE